MSHALGGFFQPETNLCRLGEEVWSLRTMSYHPSQGPRGPGVERDGDTAQRLVARRCGSGELQPGTLP